MMDIHKPLSKVVFYETNDYYDYANKQLPHAHTLLMNVQCVNRQTQKENNGLAQAEYLLKH